jgi:hypothetical protein
MYADFLSRSAKGIYNFFFSIRKVKSPKIQKNITDNRKYTFIILIIDQSR